ncbi:MAG: SelD-related putative sulfur metabolism protein [Thermoprotei archaeon]|nr:SelD-related putative sulfur metabolism protein [Thermoprotei archaeon]
MGLGYDLLFREFAERVEYYRSLGVNPFSLATGCAVKVDLVDVLYPALKSIRSELEVLGLTIAPRRDADVFSADPGSLRVLREVYDAEDPLVDAERLRAFSPLRAIVLAQVHQSLASGPEPFREVVRRFYSRIAEAVEGRIIVGKGHSIVSAHSKSQFFLVDYVSYERGEALAAANNDTIQIIDPAEDPGSPRQAAVAVANSLNDLFTVGAWRNIRVYPVYDAPSVGLKSRIRANMESYVEKLGGSFVDTVQPGRGSLLMGASVFAELRGKPPFFYDRVEPGMELLATRPFGELAIINVYMLAMLDREIAGELEAQTGVSVGELLELKNSVVDLMAKPNVEVARVIEGRLPGVGEDFNPKEHIAVTTDVTGPGIYVIKEIAELSNVSIRVDEIPLISPVLSEFATRNFIIPNATAGTNGAIVILASKQVIEGVEEELRKAGESPVRVGLVVSRGEARVKAPQKLRKYIAAKSYLKEFELS